MEVAQNDVRSFKKIGWNFKTSGWDPDPGLVGCILATIKTNLTKTNLIRLILKPFENLFVCISVIVFQFVHCDVIIPFVWKVVLLLLMTH